MGVVRDVAVFDGGDDVLSMYRGSWISHSGVAGSHEDLDNYCFIRFSVVLCNPLVASAYAAGPLL